MITGFEKVQEEEGQHCRVFAFPFNAEVLTYE
jgi:hypothetical protein